MEGILSFNVSGNDADPSLVRAFTLPRNAIVDRVIALNHLRNCVTNEMRFKALVGHIGDSVGPWISGLLRSVRNFIFTRLEVNVGSADAASAVNFMCSTRKPYALVTT